VVDIVHCRVGTCKEKMAAAGGSWTVCPVCQERLNNPKFLPCYHTFCCQCLETLCHNDLQSELLKCPVCRSEFEPPVDDDCSTLPTNNYVDEILSERQSKQDTEFNLELLQGDFEEKTEALQKAVYENGLLEATLQQEKNENTVITFQLAEKAEELQKAVAENGRLEEKLQKKVNENTRLDSELEETTLKLVVLEDHCTRVEQEMEELKRQLTAAQLRETNLCKAQREIVEKLNDAEHRFEAAKTDAATYQKSLEQEKQSCQNMLQQLQQMEDENYLMSKGLSCADIRYQEANTEAESCKRDKIEAEASLTQEKQVCQNLQQQLQQVRDDTGKQISDAERRKSEAEASLAQEKELHQSLQRETGEQKKTLKEELGQSKQEITRLKDELQMSKLKLDQQQDYKKSYTEGLLPREATRSAVLPWQVVRLSVCRSFCDVEVSWSYRLEFCENNFTAD